jgi:hypothetical protein
VEVTRQKIFIDFFKKFCYNKYVRNKKDTLTAKIQAGVVTKKDDEGAGPSPVGRNLVV